MNAPARKALLVDMSIYRTLLASVALCYLWVSGSENKASAFVFIRTPFLCLHSTLKFRKVVQPLKSPAEGGDGGSDERGGEREFKAEILEEEEQRGEER